LFCHVQDDNTVMVDGRRVGWFNGFLFNPDHEAKTLLETREKLWQRAIIKAQKKRLIKP
jgi:hypothetical protein